MVMHARSLNWRPVKASIPMHIEANFILLKFKISNVWEWLIDSSQLVLVTGDLSHLSNRSAFCTIVLRSMLTSNEKLVWLWFWWSSVVKLRLAHSTFDLQAWSPWQHQSLTLVLKVYPWTEFSVIEKFSLFLLN